MMILAVDVDYRVDHAVAAGVLLDAWNSQTAQQELTVRIEEVAEYEPGSFYKRELPCIEQLLARLSFTPDCIVVDGYVFLGEERKPGLGMHVWHLLEQRVPVIGVAKTAFAGTDASTGILRGQSDRPLFVTAVGMPQEEAQKAIRHMHGQFRLPTLLKRVDQLCRQGAI